MMQQEALEPARPKQLLLIAYRSLSEFDIKSIRVVRCQTSIYQKNRISITVAEVNFTITFFVMGLGQRSGQPPGSSNPP